MKPRLISNPPNPYHATEVEYLEGEGAVKVEYYEDHARSILARNDSPDVGFEWSVNPYRGCRHACAYCLSGDTLILMGSGAARPLSELRVGDVVYGTRVEGAYRRYVRTRVLAHWSTVKPAYRVTLEDGTKLVASGDHRFLTVLGWKYVATSPAFPLSRKRGWAGVREMAWGALTPTLSRLRERGKDRLILVAGDRLVGVGDLWPRIVSIKALGKDLPLFDITTGTGDFIANGVVSHNCYARPGHEYLGFGAGTDFETKIAAKLNAPALLREAFDKPSWAGQTLFFSGVTDCYQPLEASLRLTRGCLEVCLEYRNPVSIITKAPLIERDLELLVRLHAEAGCTVAVSIPFWDKEHARAIEPWVATPERRMEAVRRLAEAGLPVGVMVAPLIPGLNDEDLARVLTAAAAAGARWAGHTIVRLPGPVAEVFEQRIRAVLPERAERILHRIREVRGGALNDSRFGSRMRGQGPYAQTISALFQATCKRLGLNQPDLSTERPSTFRRPPRKGQQLTLF
jgi:DNA repair photolyase